MQHSGSTRLPPFDLCFLQSTAHLPMLLRNTDLQFSSVKRANKNIRIILCSSFVWITLLIISVALQHAAESFKSVSTQKFKRFVPNWRSLLNASQNCWGMFHFTCSVYTVIQPRISPLPPF